MKLPDSIEAALKLGEQDGWSDRIVRLLAETAYSLGRMDGLLAMERIQQRNRQAQEVAQ